MQNVMVPLGTLVTVKETTGPDTIYRYNRYRAVDILGQASPGHSSGRSRGRHGAGREGFSTSRLRL